MMPNRTIRKTFAMAALAVSLMACSAATQFSRSAQDHELIREDITVNNLPLVIFRDAISSRSPVIHFYLDGDGSPWIHGKRIAADPTSRSRLILALMAEDSAPKMLIGRPCYYITPSKRPSGCTNSLWTSQRYSAVVVETMAELIEAQALRFAAQEVRLIGYSGGGTLAMLIANHLSDVDVVVTIAANLNVDAWVGHHQFTPLADSLNADNFPLLSQNIRQVHFVGGQDTNVPAEITRSVASRQHNAQVIEIGDYSHGCCWPNDWASRLQSVLSGGSL